MARLFRDGSGPTTCRVVVGRVVERVDRLVVDSSQECRVVRGALQGSGGIEPQHPDRIVRGGSPQRGNRVPKYRAGVAMPAPPEVDGEFGEPVNAVGQRRQLSVTFHQFHSDRQQSIPANEPWYRPHPLSSIVAEVRSRHSCASLEAGRRWRLWYARTVTSEQTIVRARVQICRAALVATMAVVGLLQTIAARQPLRSNNWMPTGRRSRNVSKARELRSSSCTDREPICARGAIRWLPWAPLTGRSCTAGGTITRMPWPTAVPPFGRAPCCRSRSVHRSAARRSRSPGRLAWYQARLRCSWRATGPSCTEPGPHRAGSALAVARVGAGTRRTRRIESRPRTPCGR